MRGASARAVFLGVLACGYGAILYFGYPGHLTVDPAVSLYEGRHHLRESFNPAVFSWLLGALDSIHRGTGLYVLLAPLLVLGAWAAMTGLRPRLSWLGVVVAAGALALPQLVGYQGIVWKDVLFANLTVAGFVALAFGVQSRSAPARTAALLASAALIAIAALVRQNGAIVVLPALAAILWTARREGGPRTAVRAGSWLAVLVATFVLVDGAARPQGAWRPDRAGAVGLRSVQHYDLVAAAALIPGYPFRHLETVKPTKDDELRRRAPPVYSPIRSDKLGEDPALGPIFWPTPAAVIRAEWLEFMTRHPATYLGHRFEVFRWVFATPQIDLCVPIVTGNAGPAPFFERLGYAPGGDIRDVRLSNYQSWHLDTPSMSHVTYAVMAAVLMLVFLRRGQPADLAMAALMAGALLFAASFFAIALACDYRYLYFLDLAALTGLVYFALDPRLRRSS